MNFQLNVFIVFVIIAMIILYAMRQSIIDVPNKKTWPTHVSNCPDYWVDSLGDGTKCVSNAAMYNTNFLCIGTKDFSGKTYCDKLTKMKTTGCDRIAWDGMTYGYGNLTEKNKCVK